MNSAGQETIDCLRTGLPAFHGQARGQMDEVNTRRRFIHLLATGSRGPDEGFPDVVVGNAEALHSFLKRPFFCRGDGGRRHLRISTRAFTGAFAEHLAACRVEPRFRATVRVESRLFKGFRRKPKTTDCE